MPIRSKIECPTCGRELVRKPGGRCPHCGEAVGEHVVRARAREKRIEQVVAIVATFLVVALFLWAGDFGLLEGAIVYAAAGVAVWYWGKGTFWSATLHQDDSELVDDDPLR